jgi:ComF family protein
MLLRLARILAPPLCIGCGDEGRCLCAACARNLPYRKPACVCCGRNNGDGRSCHGCRRQTALSGLTIIGSYEGVVRQLVLGLKYEHQRLAAEPLGTLLAHRLAQALSSTPSFQVVTSVPTASSRLRQRGFDHARLLARAVAAELALPYRPLLYRHSNVRQVGSGRAQRLSQVEGLFHAIGPTPAAILLIDDVTTTGATLNACATALRKGGAAAVWAAVAARDL